MLILHKHLKNIIYLLVFAIFISLTFYLGRISVSPPLAPIPAITVAPTMAPTATFAPTKPVVTPNIPTSAPTSSIKYFLPDGWDTYVHPTGLFSVGYNPTSQSPMLYDDDNLWITTKNLNSNKYYSPYSSSIFLRVASYNGGSRHSFIEKMIGGPIGYNKLDSYYEENYSIDGKNCLVVHGVQISQGPTVHGMCAINSQKALFFSTYNYGDISRHLETLKFREVNQSDHKWSFYHNPKYGFILELPKRYIFSSTSNTDQHYPSIGIFKSASGEEVFLTAIVNVDIYTNSSVVDVATREIIDSNKNYAISSHIANMSDAAITNLLDGDRRRIVTIKHNYNNLYLQINLPSTFNLDEELPHLLDTFRFDK